MHRNFLELGIGQNANNYAYIDFIGDTTYTDYGLRIIRDNTGANARFYKLLHRGTGNLVLNTQEAGAINLQTNGSTSRLYIASDGACWHQSNFQKNQPSCDNINVQFKWRNVGNIFTDFVLR